jgi:hypothetical protein
MADRRTELRLGVQMEIPGQLPAADVRMAIES